MPNIDKSGIVDGGPRLEARPFLVFGLLVQYVLTFLPLYAMRYWIQAKLKACVYFFIAQLLLVQQGLVPVELMSFHNSQLHVCGYFRRGYNWLAHRGTAASSS